MFYNSKIHRKRQTGSYSNLFIIFIPTVQIIDDNIKIDGRNSFDQPVNDDIKKYENIDNVD